MLAAAVASPLAFQVGLIAQLVSQLKKFRSAADMSGTGVGKTFVALFTCKALGLRPLIVCPKSVIPAWEEAARLVGVEPIAIVNYEKLRTGKLPWLKWTWGKRVCEWSLPDPSKTLVIFDEVHRCKNRKSQNSKMLIATNRSDAKVLMLSATLAESPLDMYATGIVLEVFKSDQYYGWCFANGVVRGTFGSEYRGGTEGMLRIKDQISHRSVRLNPSEVPGFPDNLVSAVELPTEHSAAIDQHLQALEDARLLDEPLPIVDNLRARQEVELYKVKPLVEMAKDAVAEGNSVVIFQNFSASIEATTNSLISLGARGLTGQTPENERREIISQFQANELPILVCQARAGGEGISLHDVAGRPRVSLINPSYSATELLQCLGRIHRQGSKSPSVQRICFAAGSKVESRIRRQVQAKLHNLDSLNDGDLS